MTRDLSSGIQAEMDHSGTNSNSYPSSAIDNAVRASIFLSRIYPVPLSLCFSSSSLYTYRTANRLNLIFLLQTQHEASDRVWPQATLRPVPRPARKTAHVDDCVKVNPKDLESSPGEIQTSVPEVERVTKEEDFAVKVSS